MKEHSAVSNFPTELVGPRAIGVRIR